MYVVEHTNIYTTVFIENGYARAPDGHTRTRTIAVVLRSMMDVVIMSITASELARSMQTPIYVVRM